MPLYPSRQVIITPQCTKNGLKKHPIGSVNSQSGSRVTHRNKRHNHTIASNASKVRYEDKKKDEVRKKHAAALEAMGVEDFF